MPVAPLTLLLPENRVVPFAAGEGLCHDMVAWACATGPVAARLLSGPPGVGKTRLAVEVEKALRAHLGTDSVPGCLWMRPGEQPPRIGSAALVVVDDADAHEYVELAAIIEQAATVPGTRLLLLARSFGLWWTMTLGAAEEPGRALLDSAGHFALPPAGLDFSAAFRTFAARLEVDASQPPPPPSLNDRSTALDVEVAALAAVLAIRDGRRTEDSAERMAAVLRAEEKHWLATADALGVRAEAGLLRDVLTVAVVLDDGLFGDEEVETAELLLRVPALVNADVEDRVALARWLRAAYPRTAGRPSWPVGIMQRLALDRLAEHGELAERLLRTLSDRRARRGLIVLARAAAQQPSEAGTGALAATLAADLARLRNSLLAVVATGGGPALDTALAAVVQDALRAGRSVSEILPDISVFRAAGTLVLFKTAQVLDLAVSEAADTPAARAEVRRDLGLRFREQGQIDEAVATLRDAVEMHRAIPGETAGLAHALNNLFICLKDAGREAEALAVITEEVELNRALSIKDPGTHRVRYAAALSNLSIALVGNDQPDRALEPVNEAVTILRELASTESGRHDADLAGALYNQAFALNALGRHDEALAGLHQAVAIRRRQAQDDPAAFQDKLVLALAQLSATLHNARQSEQAAEVGQDAVVAARALSPRQARLHRPLVSQTLFALGVILAELDRRTNALALLDEAVSVQRELAAERPAQHTGMLDTMLVQQAAIRAGVR